MKKIIIVLLLLILLAYTSNITQIPKSLILFQGEKLKISTLVGICLNKNNKYESKQASTLIGYGTPDSLQDIGKTEFSVKLFNTIPIKNVNVDVIPKTKVIPVGQTIGLKLYTKGVLVVGISEVETNENTNSEPYINSGIKEGDTILTVNEKEVSTTAELARRVNESKGEDVKITYDSNGEVKTANIKPSMAKEGTYKLGLWVRDAAAGVGTISYYEKETKNFAALGHGIQDVDTGKLITISNGEVVTATITNIIKGEEGKPGEILGNISYGKAIGKISKNSAFGIYGKINDITALDINLNDALEIATRSEVKTGNAKIICCLEDGKKDEYEIQIQKIYHNNNEDNKSMLIKVTDKELIEKTGGIIQGMSGSPIIQDRKICWCSNTCTYK